MDSVIKRRVKLPEIAAFVMVLITIALCFVSTAQAQVKNPVNGVSLNVVDAELSSVVRMLSAESRQNIVIADSAKLHSKVTVTLRDMPLESVLKYVVESVGCSWRRDSAGVYIIGSDSQAQQAAPAMAPPTIDVGLPLANDYSSSQSVANTSEARHDSKVEVVKLYNTNCVDMMCLLGLYQLSDADKLKNSQNRPGVALRSGYDGLSHPVTPADLTPSTNESLRNDFAYSERTPSLLDDAAQFGSNNNNNSNRNNGGGSYGRSNGGNNNGNQMNSSSSGGSLMPGGIDFVMPYDLDNSLIVRGDEEGREELKNLIKQLDVAPKQIMIKAAFVEISTGASSSLGIDWTLNNLSNNFSTTFNPTGNVQLGYASGNVMATLRAKLLQNHGKVVNEPIISTLNNVPATIQIGKSYPYWTSSVTSNNNGNLISYKVTMLPIQTQLVVLPRVNNADNSITVMIQPTVSDTGDMITGPDGTEIPVVKEETLQTTRRVANGETIVLGGIIRKDDNVSVSKIPLLGDLPIIGALFRSETRSSTDTELLIFLTPTIVSEKPTAGTGVGLTP